MSKRSLFLLLVGLAIIVVVGIGVIKGNRPLATTSDGRDLAPTFSLQNYADETVSLHDFDGQIRVVNAWATWCPFCVNELPDFVTLQQNNPNITVIAINRRESLEQSRTFTDELEISDDITFLLDPKDSFYKSIGGFSMPETLFINPDGTIHLHKRGPLTEDEMDLIIERIQEAHSQLLLRSGR